MIVTLVLFLVLFLISPPLFANRGVHLRCPTRGEVTVSFFDYGLSTMKWKQKFQVAAGGISSMHIHGKPYNFIGFRNGDDFLFSPERNTYLIFQKGAAHFEACELENRFNYPAVTLPRKPDKPSVKVTPETKVKRLPVVLP